MGRTAVTSGRKRERLKAQWLTVTAWIVDRPVQVTWALTALIAAHAVLGTSLLSAVNPYKSFGVDANAGTAVTIYLGLAAAAAIVAGFAGVIIIFTIGSEAQRVRMFRRTAGQVLHRSWLTVVAEPVLATFLGIVAAVTQLTSGHVVAPWLFELGLVLLAHGSLRLLWLLHELVEIVHADDQTSDSSVEEVPAEMLFPKRTGS
ncbi:MAG: hypothetical protein GEV28_30415 [Actinophytocola sp.]|uniref:hypothetical protein n=1 Tax=Actinophytocola sp. TaxID=1872138 RepID=UPI00132A7248|nr:hypothetical protein [Actinophytocola sp.]MPZ84472.1 hypothetical protein [Actinophytocola sp.]